MPARAPGRRLACRTVVPIFVVALVALVAAGCGSSKKKTTSPTPASTTTTPAPAASSSVKLSADPGGAIKFTQTAASAKAGKVTLVMTNPASSGLQHGIAVEGNGVDKDGAIVGPGKTSTVAVNLKPGTYTFYCPFDGHKAAGMTGKLPVK
jgi:plastocyanin